MCILYCINARLAVSIVSVGSPGEWTVTLTIPPGVTDPNLHGRYMCRFTAGQITVAQAPFYLCQPGYEFTTGTTQCIGRPR